MISLCRALFFQSLFWPGFVILFFISTPLLFFPARSIVWVQKMFVAYALFWMRWIAGITVRIEGKNNIPNTPCIIAPRHESFFDTFIYYFIFHNPAIVFKKELLYIPICGQFLKKFQMIPVSRYNRKNKESFLRYSMQAMQNNRHIIIFPEGTRLAPGKKIRLKSGVTLLGRQLNIPVVPVATNSGSHWPRRRLWKKPGTIVVKFLPPQPLEHHRQFLHHLGETLFFQSQQLRQDEDKK